MKQQPFSITKRLNSAMFAINGLVILFKEEHNSRIHLLAAVSTVICGIYLRVSPHEWIALVLVIGLVFILEILNTAIENIADYISPGKNNQIKKIKDLAAAGVLVSSVTALITGLVIFVPKIIGQIHLITNYN